MKMNHMKHIFNDNVNEIIIMRLYLIIFIYIIYVNKTGDEPQKQDTTATKRTPHLKYLYINI